MPCVQARLLALCLVPPTPLGRQPRPCGHRNAPSLGGHLPTSSVRSSPASRSVNANVDLGSRPARAHSCGQPCSPPSPMQTNRRQPPAASPCTAAGGKSLHRAGNSSRHPQIAGPPRTHRAAGQIRAWPVHVPASMQRRAEAACSLLRSPAPGLPLPCAPGAATNLRRSRRSRWSRFPRGCWSCRHRAPSPRAPRP